jgi:hypothetical protein
LPVHDLEEIWDIPDEFGVNSEEIDNLRRKKIPIKGEANPASACIEKYVTKEHNPNVIPKAKIPHRFHPSEISPKKDYKQKREPAATVPERRFVFLDELPKN